MSAILTRATPIVTAADLATTPRGETRPVNDLLDDLAACGAVDEAEILVENGDGDVFRDAGLDELKEYGASTRFTFTRTALDLSGFTEEEPVAVYARPDALLLVSEADDRDLAGGVVEVVRVRLSEPHVTDEHARTIRAHGATIVPESVQVTADGTLAFSLALPTAFDRVTEWNVRPFGDSTAFTIPAPARDAAGLGPGDTVGVSAAAGAVLLRREEA